ncbi:helix-turn-helix domain-containing protein [Halorussus salinisoli]|uniref:helix-turn-helix domain-containing protein n=1 Tax=Halorussus salinisoli TaxID=2558242 RepID=UPI0010C16553
MGKLDARMSDVRSIELDNAFYVEDGSWIESLTVSTTTDFDPDELVADVSGVDLVYSREIPTGPTGVTVQRLMLVANESYPFVLGIVLRREAIPNRLVLQGEEMNLVITVQDWEQFRALADDIQDSLGQFELESMNQIETPGEPLDGGRLSEVLITKLADEQLTVLETAYNMGYFDVPREATAQDVADRLDISQSTFSERLRTAERSLFDLVYGSRD